MTSKQELRKENEALRNIIKNTFWMARRYAHGRHTYATGMVREAYDTIKRLEIDIGHPDDTLEPPKESDIHGMAFRKDYLDDIK